MKALDCILGFLSLLKTLILLRKYAIIVFVRGILANTKEKFMNDEPMMGVSQKVRTGDAVTQMTRVFLASAIGMGVVASAMGFLFFGEVKEATVGRTVRNAPLLINDVIGAAAIQGVAEAQEQYSPVTFNLGSTPGYRLLTQSGEDGEAGSDFQDLGRTTTNQPLVLKATNAIASNWDFFDISPKIARAQTTFSIDPITNPTYINTQFIRLTFTQTNTTGPTTVNICVGLTSATTLYVGKDGSTYTDKNLTRRTTTQGCKTIASRALRVGDVTNVEFAQDPTIPVAPDNEILVHRTGFLGKIKQSDFEFQKNGAPRENFSDPVMLTYLGSNPAGADLPFSIPDMIVNLQDYSVVGVIDDNPDPKVYTLCFPGKTFDHGNVGQNYYFDIDGRAYFDIMLSRPASAARCTDVNERAFRVSSVHRASVLLNGLPSQPNDLGWKINNGRVVVRTVKRDATLVGENNMGNSRWPIYIEPQYPYSLPGGAVTGPTKIHLTGEWVGLRDPSEVYSRIVCIPLTTFDIDPSVQLPRGYFYDKNGLPFTDIFLTYRANSDDNCPQTVSGGYAPAAVRTMSSSVTPTHPYTITAMSGKYQYGELTANGFEAWGSLQTPFQGLPLSLELGGWPEPTNIPVQAVTITETTGATKTVCWGPFTPGNMYDASTIVYYGANGQGYRDLFLQQPINCTLPSTGGSGEPITIPIKVE